MAAQKFSFGNALSHWTNTEGPPGYVWKHALAFGLLTVAIGALMMFLMGGSFIRYMMIAEEASTGAANPQEVLDAAGAFFLPFLLFIPIGILFWAAFEGAQQRRYIRGQGFSLRIGADEGRLIVVGLLWILTLIGLYLAIAILFGALGMGVGMAVGDSPLAAGILVFVLLLAIYGTMLFFIVKLSPAAALTIRDEKIKFTSAWGVTKGRFWTMFFAFIVMGIVAIILALILQFALGLSIMGAMSANPDIIDGTADPEDVMSILFSPTTFLTLGVVYFFMSAFQGVLQFAFAGIPALAAKTDPNWAGSIGTADTFS